MNKLRKIYNLIIHPLSILNNIYINETYPYLFKTSLAESLNKPPIYNNVILINICAEDLKFMLNNTAETFSMANNMAELLNSKKLVILNLENVSFDDLYSHFPRIIVNSLYTVIHNKHSIKVIKNTDNIKIMRGKLQYFNKYKFAKIVKSFIY